MLSEIPSRAPDELAQIKPLNAMCSLDPPLTAEVCPGMDSTLQGDDYAQALVLNRLGLEVEHHVRCARGRWRWRR